MEFISSKMRKIWGFESFFEKIFEIAKILQIYKRKVGMGNFKSAIFLYLVHQFCSKKSFLKTCRIIKQGKPRSLNTWLLLKRKCAIAKGRSCGFLRPIPGLIGSKLQSPTSNLNLNFNPEPQAKIQLQVQILSSSYCRLCENLLADLEY